MDNNFELVDEFDRSFRQWVKTACQEWKLNEPSEEYFSHVKRRLPEGLRTLLGYGLKHGLIIPTGRVFTLKDMPPSKGPYNWFSQGRTTKPSPNWEYFVQIAEFIRFFRISSTTHGLSVKFEDSLMDVGVYRNNKLFVYVEVKEKGTQLQKLVQEMKKLQYSIDLTIEDRGNDPLRKAKYLVTQRPEYLVLSAIGTRFEYKVVYPDDTSFEIVSDMVPLT
ncbi:MAG: hypothetical protein Q8Q07_08590 [Dehalococcoidales bacterium]|nr:hypothetical protein [Dehalococcoidales bacterium]